MVDMKPPLPLVWAGARAGLNLVPVLEATGLPAEMFVNPCGDVTHTTAV